MFSTVGPVLHFLGFGLGTDVRLLTKICRLSRDLVKNHKDILVAAGEGVEGAGGAGGAGAGSAEHDWLLRILRGGVMPAINVLDDTNPGICSEVWELMRLLPYEDRYGPVLPPPVVRVRLPPVYPPSTGCHHYLSTHIGYGVYAAVYGCIRVLYGCSNHRCSNDTPCHIMNTP